MSTTGYCCLRIIDDNLDFTDIECNIKLQPTQIFRKGEASISKYGSTTYKEDSWIYEVHFEAFQDIDSVLCEFTSTFDDCIGYLKAIYSKYYVRLWCDVYSDNAQFSITLSPSTAQKIANLGIGIDIQVYSHGDIE